MTEIYSWVRNITFYMIFLSVAENLLADSRYEKYLRFFGGIVLILLVVQPVTGILGLDQKAAGLFQQLSVQMETGDLQDRLREMEEQRQDQVVLAYQNAIGQDISRMAEERGFSCLVVRTEIEEDPESPDYGRLRSVYMELGPGRTGEEESQDGTIRIPMIQAGEGERENREEDLREKAGVNELIGKVGEYYELEPGAVQAVWKDDEKPLDSSAAGRRPSDAGIRAFAGKGSIRTGT